MLVIFKEVLLYELIKGRSLYLQFRQSLQDLDHSFEEKMLDINGMTCGATDIQQQSPAMYFHPPVILFVFSALFSTHHLHVSGKV